MNYVEEIRNFAIEGFNNCTKSYLLKKPYRHVLQNKEENFISIPSNDFRYHIHAGSLTSSQAFSYNMFSGVKDCKVEFEHKVKVFSTPSQIDVKLEHPNKDLIELFEVKVFELIDRGKNKIDFAPSYWNSALYRNPILGRRLIEFLNDVIKHFTDQNIYGGGIKQLCSHLIGLVNSYDATTLSRSKFILYSLCHDYPFIKKYEEDLESYQNATTRFKLLVDKLLRDLDIDTRIAYHGYIGASEYMHLNLARVGQVNYDYVNKRYFNSNAIVS